MLQEAKAHRRIHEEIKVQGNKMSAIDLRLEWQKKQEITKLETPDFL